ncbi:phage portal protein [Deferrisoma camini]|uniref:phage portal protein n=1 Tax=Deferrisoma camini TaxID=1035120 RepID=UPI0004B9D70B|nr:phage portal protein [Deferrisoma camini]
MSGWAKLGRLMAQGRRYAAAKTTRLTGDWQPIDVDVNELIGQSAPIIRARVRQLVRDFPYFARAVNNLIDFGVGEGLTLQARVRDPDGNLMRQVNRRIEDAWKWWCDEADISGVNHLHEHMRLAKRTELESGAFLYVLRVVREPGRYLPLAVQAYEVDWLTDSMARPQGRNRVVSGVEIDPDTGRRVAYHMADPQGLVQQPVRVPADRVLHGFQTLRPGQVLGVSPFAPAVLLTHALRDVIENEVGAAQLASRWVAFVYSLDPGSIFPGAQRETAADGSERVVQEVEGGLVELLRPGEKVEFASYNRPAESFGLFVKFVLRTVAATIGTSYDLLAADYSEHNYSSLRVSRSDLTKQLRPVITRHVRQFCQPLFHAFLEWAVLSGRLDLPGYWRNPWAYRRVEWMPPGQEPIDPLREIKADVEALRAGLIAPQQIVARRGWDLEEVYAQIAEARRMAEEAGIELDLGTGSTALQQNPAALGASEERVTQALLDGDDEAVTAALIGE